MESARRHLEAESILAHLADGWNRRIDARLGKYQKLPDCGLVLRDVPCPASIPTAILLLSGEDLSYRFPFRDLVSGFYRFLSARRRAEQLSQGEIPDARIAILQKPIKNPTG